MKIRVFDKLDDVFLKSEWERLEKAGDVFPQSRYHWCLTWWKHLRRGRKLHIVMALDVEGKALAIAPLCIERHFCVHVLRSMPIHFGDFYTFIVSAGNDSFDAISAILDYIASAKQWSWVRLEQVTETSILALVLAEQGYLKKRMTGSVVVDFADLSWDEYLGKLDKRFRKNIRSRQRKIDNKFESELRVISQWESYAGEYDKMRLMHEQRWADDHTSLKGKAEVACWHEAIQGQFNAGKMVYYRLMFDDNQVAYRLGFIHNHTYYAWHTGFNPEYRDYYPGIMIISYMIREYMKNDISSINFMAGDYDWKLEWSPEREVVSHYMFSSPSNNWRAAVLNRYHYRFRDKLKDWYHTMMRNRILRALSRKVIGLQQRMAGQS